MMDRDRPVGCLRDSQGAGIHHSWAQRHSRGPRHDRCRPGQNFSSLRKAIGVELLSPLAESR